MFRALLCPSSGARDYNNNNNIYLLQLGCHPVLITTLVVSFYKDGGGSVNVKLWFLVVCVRCEVLCRFVVAGNVFLLMLIVV